MEKLVNSEFGALFKKLRMGLGSTLRQFCLDNGFDPGNLSKMERGILPPPTSREKLERYAEALKLTEGSDDWYDFFDFAAAQAGRIPEDVLNNSRVIGKLPVFFRTVRGQQVADEDLDALVKLIQES